MAIEVMLERLIENKSFDTLTTSIGAEGDLPLSWNGLDVLRETWRRKQSCENRITDGNNNGN